MPQSVVSLPQFRAHARPGGCGPLKSSARGKWRAAVLILVHLIIAAHLLHWKLAGVTLTPLEPSESVQTLDDGLINAGFILFALAILSTLIFGRFFCGWACHVVAYQDLCSWILRKLGLRPKPFRSRLLVFVPLGAALYMFVFPVAHRLGYGLGWPRFEAHFYTDDFWRTFPNLPITLLTLAVCGGLIVYLLGNKGFCTYGCPYGGFFGPADAFAPGKIRVTDACEGCGHCTASCTSNVRVHEEVRLYGMVVDPGCMKCMDCVDVCPKDALYFGFGPPAVAKPAARAQAPLRSFDYSWPEELWLAALFLAALYAFRGLYDLIPFLLALGLSAISAFLLLTAARVFYHPAARLHHWQLRTPARVTPAGWAFTAGAAALVALIGHSAFVQYHTFEGDYWMNAANVAQRSAARAETDEVRRLSRRSLDHYETATRSGLFTNHVAEARLGGLYYFFNDLDAAERHLRVALATRPDYADAAHKLAETLARRGQPAAALQQLAAVLRAVPDRRQAPTDLAELAIASRQTPAAIEILNEALRRRPRHTEARLALVRVLLADGATERAAAELQRLLSEDPDVADAHFRLALLRLEQRDFAAAAAGLRRVIELQPRAAPPHFLLGEIARLEGRPADMLPNYSRARELAPFNREYLAAWALAVRDGGGLAATLETLKSAPADDDDAQYGLVFLFLAAGDESAAKAQFERVHALRPDLPPP